MSHVDPPSCSGADESNVFLWQLFGQRRTQSSTILAIVSMNGCYATRTELECLFWAPPHTPHQG